MIPFPLMGREIRHIPPTNDRSQLESDHIPHQSTIPGINKIHENSYDYPYTQSEWWGNAKPVKDPANLTRDGFFISPFASDYKSSSIWTDHAPIYIDSNSGFWEFPGLGTADQPYVIENLHIQSVPENPRTLSISYTTAHFIIRNCIIENSNENGIELWYVAPYTGIIENNTVRNCKASGIFCRESDGVEISNNRIRNCSYNGIHLEICSKFEISENYINECASGIIFAMCDEMNAYHNTIESMEYDGIYQDDDLTKSCVYANNITECGGDGMIFIGTLNNCNFTSNIITKCSERGLYLQNAQNCRITENIIANNSNSGIRLENSQNNLIYFNDIYGNKIYEAYESEDSSANHWDNGSYGNYWGATYKYKYPNAIHLSYICWNIPYEISGLGDGIDNFPLIHSITVEFKEETETTTETTTETITETITEPEIPFVHGFNSLIIVVGSISCIIGIIFLTRKRQK